VIDVIEFKVAGEALYLSSLMDLYNGEIVAYQSARRPTFDLVWKMLKKVRPSTKTGTTHCCIRIRGSRTECRAIDACLPSVR
jgi:putative transposase